MEKLKSLLSRLSGMNLAHLLVLGIVVKAIMSDISIPTFLVTIPVLGYEAYQLYLKAQQPSKVTIDSAVMKELEALKSKVNAVTMERKVAAPGNIPRLF